MLSVGSDAPDFSAQDQDANQVTRSGLSGKWIAMWWYPKASTPG
ncbi:MAG: redoxin domain-containing protein [bacterium]|nr:redoxin domain-containing protein [bacterium]